MNHPQWILGASPPSTEVVQVLGQIALVVVVPGLPVLYFIYSDRFSRLPSPGQLSVLFAMIILAGALLGLPALSVVGATALLGMGLAWLSAHYALTDLTYQRTLTPPRLFPGDEAELTIHLENRKILPLGWLEIVDPIDFRRVRNDRHLEDVLQFSGGVERLDTREDALTNRMAIGPYQSLTRTYRVTAMRRGVYQIGPARAESGDPFGLFEREAEAAPPLEILVYPHIYQPEDIGFPFREALGELIPHRALLDDPMLLAGTREYRPGDPLHRMHWKATARTGELQVRINDPSTTANIFIVLNLNTFQYMWQGVDIDRMERSIDAAASLAVWALKKGYAVGLRANGTVAGSDMASRIATSAHPQQTSIILEHLARMTYSSRLRPEYVLMDEARRLDARTTLVFVTPVLTSELTAILTAPNLNGRLSVVYCSTHAAPVVPGIPIYFALPTERQPRVEHVAS